MKLTEATNFGMKHDQSRALDIRQWAHNNVATHRIFFFFLCFASICINKMSKDLNEALTIKMANK